jgi:two-component system response regulator RegA
MNAALDAARMPTLLLVDDDPTFREVLARALRHRGFDVVAAEGVADAMRLTAGCQPQYAVIDLRMPGASGLELLTHLGKSEQPVRTVVLTAYASIATAVEAIKLGAVHYLTKPADADEIVAALTRDAGDPTTPVPARPLSVERLEWEHLQKVINESRGNVSEAARRLGMHRRTLQRKLAKRPTRR